MDVEDADQVEHRLAQQLDRGVAEVGRDVGVAEVEADRDRRRADPPDEAAEQRSGSPRATRAPGRAAPGSRSRSSPRAARRPRAWRVERARLGDQRRLGLPALGQGQRVVDDLGRADLRGVGEQRPRTPGRPLGCRRAGSPGAWRTALSEVVAERRGRRDRVGGGQPGDPEHRGRRRVQLHPVEPGGLVGLEQRRRGPPLVRDAEPEAAGERIGPAARSRRRWCRGAWCSARRPSRTRFALDPATSVKPQVNGM